jgi:hypothetical protein
MKFNSLTTMIMSVALMAGLATAYNPIGQSCDTPGEYPRSDMKVGRVLTSIVAGGEGCSQDSSLNGGNAFIYECSGANEFVYVAGCRCPTCCEATTSGAFCT